MRPAHAVILAISDSTGETSEQAGKAALAQFGLQEEGTVRTISSIRSVAALEETFIEARRIHALVVYTLVTHELRHCVRDLAARHEVTAVDLIGGIIRGLAEHLQRAPLSVPGLSHELTDEYFRRIAAVEFAVNQDDGKNPQNLHRADIVLVGISRTSKTPLSNYIANRGLKVANVPFVPELPLPRELAQVDPRRVFALRINAVTLKNIRQTRMEKLRMQPGSDYGDLRQIRREISHANRLFDQHPEWTQIDVSRKAVEEAAATVLEVYRESFPREGSAESTPEAASPATGEPAEVKPGSAKRKKTAAGKASKGRAAKKASAKKSTARKTAVKKTARKRASSKSAAGKKRTGN